MVLEDQVQEEGPRLKEGEVPEETMETVEGLVTGGSGARLETLAPVEEVQEARLGTCDKVQALISAVRELTEVVKNGFEELRKANHLQRLVNEDRIERIKKRNWRSYEKLARRKEWHGK